MARTAQQRLDAIIPAMAARDDFLNRLQATGALDDLAVLMAEAIDMHLAANGHEPVGKDGRVRMCIEDVAASHCLKAARDAFMSAKN